MSHLIDLGAPRTIVVRQGSKPESFTVEPIPEAAWFKYFDGIVSTAQRDGQNVVQHIDAASAGVELVNGSLAAQGIDPNATPIGLRLGVANVLTSAYAPEEAQKEALDFCGGDGVVLHAIWSAGENGAMRRHKSLLHVFKTPSAEQFRRYRRDDTRSHVVGGARKGTTVYHGAQRTLAALYDELILSVAGYEANADPLTDPAQIVRWMDTFHKVAAAAQLLTPAPVDIEEDDEEA